MHKLLAGLRRVSSSCCKVTTSVRVFSSGTETVRQHLQRVPRDSDFIAGMAKNGAPASVVLDAVQSALWRGVPIHSSFGGFLVESYTRQSRPKDAERLYHGLCGLGLVASEKMDYWLMQALCRQGLYTVAATHYDRAIAKRPHALVRALSRRTCCTHLGSGTRPEGGCRCPLGPPAAGPVRDGLLARAACLLQRGGHDERDGFA